MDKINLGRRKGYARSVHYARSIGYGGRGAKINLGQILDSILDSTFTSNISSINKMSKCPRY